MKSWGFVFYEARFAEDFRSAGAGVVREEGLTHPFFIDGAEDAS